MKIGVCELTLRLHGTGSLKEKRSIMKGLLARLMRELNAGVAEIDAHDLWGKAVIACCTVSNSESVIHGTFRQLESIVSRFPGVEPVEMHVTLI